MTTEMLWADALVARLSKNAIGLEAGLQSGPAFRHQSSIRYARHTRIRHVIGTVLPLENPVGVFLPDETFRSMQSGNSLRI
jgi:hypothetical protein